MGIDDNLSGQANHADVSALLLDGFKRVRGWAPWLKEVEVKILLYFADNQNPLTQTAESSSREIADAMRIDWRTVKLSLQSLARTGLVLPGPKPGPLKTIYHLNFLNMAPIGTVAGGISTTRPVSENTSSGGNFNHPPAFAPPEMYTKTRLAGGISTTPPLSSGGKFPPLQTLLPKMDIDTPRAEDHHARAPVDSIRFDSIKPIDRFEGQVTSDTLLDRVLTAKPSNFDPGLIAKARGLLQGYWDKLSREPHSQPPDSAIAAQFLTVAGWPDLQNLINNLVGEQQVPGSSPAWFVTVALQRLHGVPPVVLKKRRRELRLMKDKPDDPAITGTEQQTQEQLFEEGRSLAVAEESAQTKAHRERMERRRVQSNG